MSALIHSDALAALLGAPNLRIMDASWHMPAEKRNAHAEYEQEHLPGAVFFDIDAVSDHTSPYPHMLPTAETFAESMASLGIAKNDTVVVYDTPGLFSAARLWWMLRLFGYGNAQVLDGGLPKWKAENRPIESGAPHIKAIQKEKPELHTHLLRTMDQLRTNLASRHELVIDARSAGRFDGKEPEPRPGLRNGHIEGSKNLFFKDVLNAPYNTLKPPAELREIFRQRDIDPARPLVASCGSGVTACILALALSELGNKDVAVYDGAWAEWGSQ